MCLASQLATGIGFLVLLVTKLAYVSQPLLRFDVVNEMLAEVMLFFHSR